MNRIKELRLNLGYTQKNIAEVLGCNQTAVGKYEREELEPNIDVLSKLADFFNCSIDYLVGRENDFGIIQQTNNALTENENQVIALYRKLNVHDQHKVLGFIQALAY